MNYAAALGQPPDNTASYDVCPFENTHNLGYVVAAFKQLMLKHSDLRDLMRHAGNLEDLSKHIGDITDINHPAIATVRADIAILLDTHFFSAIPIALSPSHFLFLYDRLKSLEKIAAIQHLLEARNLILMGGTPSPGALPISLAVFGAYLTTARARWPEIEAEGSARQRALYAADNTFGPLYAIPPPV